MLAPVTLTALPWRAVATMRIGVATTAARKPKPWLTLFAISSPNDCGRSSICLHCPTPRGPTAP